MGTITLYVVWNGGMVTGVYSSISLDSDNWFRDRGPVMKKEQRLQVSLFNVSVKRFDLQ